MLLDVVQGLLQGRASGEFAWISIVCADLAMYGAVGDGFVSRLVGVSVLIAQSEGWDISEEAETQVRRPPGCQ